MGKYVPDSEVKRRTEEGYNLAESYFYQKKKRSFIWVLVLFFTFGWLLGVHRLYAGKVWKFPIYFGALLGVNYILSFYDLMGFEGPFARHLSEHRDFSDGLFLIALALFLIIPMCELLSALSDLEKKNLQIRAQIRAELRAEDAKPLPHAAGSS